jgi:hypothetical protein
MTSYSIVVNGPLGTYDITDRTMSASWSRSLGESSATLDLQCKNILENHCMDAITLTVNGAICFSGIIKSQSDDYDQTMKRTNLKCVDNTDKLQRLLVAETFTEQTAKEIITSLRNKYASWLGVTNVEDIGGDIETLTLNYETFASAVEKLSELTGAYWNIDALDRLSFFLDDAGPAPINYTPSRVLEGSFSVDSTALDLSNRVWIIGAKQASPTFIEQSFVGDNNNQFYSLAYVPNYPEVWENNVSKTIEIDKGDTATSDYIYNKKEKVLKRVAGNLPNGVSLKIRYRPTIQVIDYFEDPSSVAMYGLYEKAIRDKKITDKAAARKRGRAELKKKKKIIRNAKFSTRDWQVSPGQLTRLTLPMFSIDSLWRIQSIDVDFSPEDILASISVEEVEQ